MTDLRKFKEEKLEKLYARLQEINDMIGLENNADFVGRDDAFATGIKMRKIELMKQHFDEMMEIKAEIAKLEN